MSKSPLIAYMRSIPSPSSAKPPFWGAPSSYVVTASLSIVPVPVKKSRLGMPLPDCNIAFAADFMLSRVKKLDDEVGAVVDELDGPEGLTPLADRSIASCNCLVCKRVMAICRSRVLLWL